MAQFSVKIMLLTGSVLGENQHPGHPLSEKRFGTWFAETIRASGRVRRANRPDTRLLLTSAKSGEKCLTMQELSTQDIRVDLC
jgi:hypothetical protein